ncbi:hypothetical protein HPB48_021674 [Haemaphysalis longicornis]|uniref:G-protein coupled receptors family 1 profile domain-containing protein n=1 Tax=Haemaphysalis longicornis TaxID=44386 RepID=A0A9J6F9U3_HAELO|nr:hypothetical protein HPB48_021674 [Haemaphysalis longicornis]
MDSSFHLRLPQFRTLLSNRQNPPGKKAPLKAPIIYPSQPFLSSTVGISAPGHRIMQLPFPEDFVGVPLADNSSGISTDLRDNLSALLELTLNLTSGRRIVRVDRERQWVLSAWSQLLYALLFGTVVLVAVCGNALVVWSVVSHRRMRTVTNQFLVNLSVADFMTAVFNAAFNSVYMLESHWTFGEPYCVFGNFVANLTVACSAFTMAAMSIDR